MTIDEIGYVEWIRQRLGLDEEDTSMDEYIESLEPLDRVRLIAGWKMGDGSWADTFKDYFESQGLYLTTNCEDKDII